MANGADSRGMDLAHTAYATHFLGCITYVAGLPDFAPSPGKSSTT
jgi:hypothetical protein